MWATLLIHPEMPVTAVKTGRSAYPNTISSGVSFSKILAIMLHVLSADLSDAMKTSFVRIYLLGSGIVLAVTAMAKLPAIFHTRNWCADDSILGRFQPAHLSNEQLLSLAASTEGLIVLLICFSPWRWLPCICSAAWGLLCFSARLFLMNPYANCHCLGWFARPGPTTNLIAFLLALLLAGGGWLAFRNAWHGETPARQNQTSEPV
jgi:hypothetical protein